MKNQRDGAVLRESSTTDLGTRKACGPCGLSGLKRLVSFVKWWWSDQLADMAGNATNDARHNLCF